LPPEKLTVVEEAYQYAAEAHHGQMRKSGDPYLEHPLQTALILAELQLDGNSLAAALLHDVPENCGVPIAEIEARFGAEISKLVDGTTKLGKVSWQAPRNVTREVQAENLRKMLVAMAEDLRVVFIKLADRLHNMRTLEPLTPEQQQGIAQETLELYAPLAHRLGIWELKWQLEDLAFRYLEPEKYRRVVNLVAAQRVQRESFIDQVIGVLRDEFERVDLRVEVSGRNIRQVHLIHAELLDDLKEKGFTVLPGQLGENITTRRIDLLSLPRGTHMQIGKEALVEVTALRNPCHQIDEFQNGLLQALSPRDENGELAYIVGVMGVVLVGGEVHPCDGISVKLPPAPHEPLQYVW
jgi:hypothetical protein